MSDILAEIIESKQVSERAARLAFKIYSGDAAGEEYRRALLGVATVLDNEFNKWQKKDQSALLAKQARFAKKRINHKQPTITDTGTYFVAADRLGLFTSKRHTGKHLEARAEAERLASAHHDRFLVLQVVGWVDKRPVE